VNLDAYAGTNSFHVFMQAKGGAYKYSDQITIEVQGPRFNNFAPTFETEP